MKKGRKERTKRRNKGRKKGRMKNIGRFFAALPSETPFTTSGQKHWKIRFISVFSLLLSLW